MDPRAASLSTLARRASSELHASRRAREQAAQYTPPASRLNGIPRDSKELGGQLPRYRRTDLRACDTVHQIDVRSAPWAPDVDSRPPGDHASRLRHATPAGRARSGGCNADGGFGQGHRNRPRHHELGGRDHGGRPADRDPERGGRTHDPLRGELHRGWRAPGRRDREAPVGDESEGHHLLHQALHGPAPLRGAGGDQARALRRRRRQGRRGRGARARQELHAARDLGDDAPEAQGRGRGLPRREGHRGGDHRAGVLQRRAAPGHQGRRRDRRPRRQAHHQRADRGGARLRARQEEGREDRRLRLRRRHLRHLDPRGGRERRRGEGHQRRHASGWRQPRPAPDRLPDRRVQEGPGHRPLEGFDGAPAPARGGGEGQGRALERGHHRHQSALHHGGQDRAEAHDAEAHPREVRAAGRGPDRPHARALPRGAQGFGLRRRATSTR